MNSHHWLRSLVFNQTAARQAGQALSSRARRLRSGGVSPRFEILEDRLAPATISISDAAAIEGNATLRITDKFVAPDGYGLAAAEGIAVGPDGNVYVASHDTDVVKVFEGGTGRFLRDLAAPGDLDGPWAVKFGKDNRLYVSGDYSHNIVRFDIVSGAAGVFATTDSGLAWGLAFGPDGDLYGSYRGISGGGASADRSVRRFSGATGADLGYFVPPGSPGLTGAFSPADLNFGPDGNLYVISDRAIQRYNGQTGAFIDTFVPRISSGNGMFYMHFHTDGYLYVTYQFLDTALYRYSATTGAFVDKISGPPGLDPTGYEPHKMAFAPTGECYVGITTYGHPGQYVTRYAPSSFAAFNVSLDTTHSTPVSVDFTTANGTAIAGNDYVQNSGTLTFAPGETTRTILVRTIDDANSETTESFSVNLSNPVGATISDVQGIGTIFDNEILIPVATTTAVVAKPIASTGGQLVTLTATVTPSPGNLGNVSFKGDGGVLAANVPVASGIAVLQISTLTPGAHSLRADYSGAAGFAASSSNIVNLVVSTSTPQLDQIAPNVVSINRSVPAAATTNASSVTVAVTFSEAVTGVDPTDFQVVKTGTVGTTLLQVTPVSTSVYTVTISAITGSGTLGLNLVDDGSIRDLVGNPLATARARAAFAPQAIFGTSKGPVTATIGDVNGDGRPDLAVTNYGDNTVSVLLGNGNGTFQAQQTYATGVSPNAATLGDVNGDGKPDLAVANTGGATVSVLLGNGNGTFQTQQTFATGDYPNSVTLGDVNGDGKPDLAVANYPDGSDAVSVLLGNGDGTFQAQQNFATGISPYSATLGDVNGDGKLDLAVANRGSATAGVLLGNGDGTFQPQQAFATGTSPNSLTLEDVNGDGKLDVAVANRGGATVSVLLGNGNGTFQAQQTFATSTNPYSVTLGDVNGDGKPDLAVTNLGSATVSVLLSNGNGTFQPQQTFATGNSPNGVTLGDVNGDGKADLVTANYGNGTVSVLLGNRSGNFTGQTYTIVPSSPPQLLSVTPNSNIPGLAGSQRSRVASLVVAFDQAVQLDPSALALALHTNNVSLGGALQPNGFGSLPTSLSFSTTDNMTWIVTFTGNTDTGFDGFNSLKDGVYDLNIDAAKVHLLAAPGVTMAANSTTTFHRLFGDTGVPATPTGGTPGTDFEAIVNTGDNFAFRAAFNKPIGGGYQALFDFNGDGIVNTADNLQFRSRFNKSLSWRV